MVHLFPSMFIGAAGKDLISFGAGQIDSLPPKNVFKAFKQFKEFRYGPVQGNLDLRTKLASVLKKEYKHNEAKPENIVITNGASEALYLALRCIVKPGDKVLITRPYYFSFPKLVQVNDATPVYSDLNPDHTINIEDIKEKIKGVKAVIINSPSNPTGKVQPKKILKEIEGIAKESNKYILADEAYSKLIYEGEHYSPKGEHVITINSFSKTYSLCGLRVGFAYCPNHNLVEQLVERKTHTSINTDIVAQQTALEALRSPQSYHTNVIKSLKERRDIMYDGLLDLGFEVEKPEGAFYVFPKVHNAQQMCEELYKKKKVITFMGEWFGAPNHLRLCYCQPKDKLKEGLKRIGDYLKNRNK
jgi:aspartate aminotransferase